VGSRVNPSPVSPLVGLWFAMERLVGGAAPGLAQPAPGAVRQVPGIVASTFQSGRWDLDNGRLVLEPIPRLRLSSFLMIRDAALAGAGVALMPESIAWHHLARGDLVQWGVVSGADPALWVLHTSRRLAAPKVRAFVDFLCARYTDMSLVLNG